MDSRQTIRKIISSENREIENNYRRLIFIYIGLTVALIVLYNYLFLKESESGIQILMLTFIPPNATIILVLILSIIKWKNYLVFRFIILLNNNKDRYHTNTYFMRIIGRAFFSSVFCLASITSGIIALFLIKNTFLPAKSFGFVAVYYSIVFFFIYGILVLPRLISFKTNKSENIYFYWFQYFKSMMVNSPLGMYLSAVLFVIISASVVFLSFTYTAVVAADGTENKHFFEIKDFFRTDIYGMAITILGLWLATFILIISDFLKNYIRLYKCYEEYTTHILRQRIIEANYINYIVIGIGNLGKIVGGFLAAEMLKIHKDKHEKHPLALFECFIDRDFEIRVIPRSMIFIEKNISLFEETRLDNESGLTYGFINGNDLSYENNEYRTMPPELAVFSINGDGGYLPMLDLADFSTSKIIINTSSDPDLGFKMKMLVDTQVKTPKKPIIITTVEDSSTYAFLEDNNDVTIFPLHAGMTEGNSIATRLFAMFIKINGGLNPSNKKVRLFIAGSGKTLYYSLYSFINILQQFFSLVEVKSFIETNLIIVTNDEELLSESVKEKTGTDFPNRYQWVIRLMKNDIFKLKLVFHDPAGFHGLYNAFEWVKDDFKTTNTDFNKYEYIFLLSTRKNHDAIRTCQHIKQLADTYQLKSCGVLASVTLDVYRLIEEQLNAFGQLNTFLRKNRRFPGEVKDIILKKNLIIGRQIISIAECFREKDYFDDRKAHYLKNTSQPHEPITGELAMCINEAPGTFSQILARLGGLSEPEIPARRKLVPSFYNNYTYTLNTPAGDLKNTYIFRGDVSLISTGSNKSEPLVIDSYKPNGSDAFNAKVSKLVTELFHDALKNHQCCT